MRGTAETDGESRQAIEDAPKMLCARACCDDRQLGESWARQTTADYSSAVASCCKVGECEFSHTFDGFFIPLSIRDKVHFEIGNWLRLNLESTRPPTETVKNNENDFENKLKISIYTRRDTPSCEWNVTRCWTQFEKGNKTGQDRIPESQHYLAAQEEKGYKILIIK